MINTDNLQQTINVINSCENQDHLKAAVKYAELAMLKDHPNIKIAIVSRSHQLRLPEFAEEYLIESES